MLSARFDLALDMLWDVRQQQALVQDCLYRAGVESARDPVADIACVLPLLGQTCSHAMCVAATLENQAAWLLQQLRERRHALLRFSEINLSLVPELSAISPTLGAQKHMVAQVEAELARRIDALLGGAELERVDWDSVLQTVDAAATVSAATAGAAAAAAPSAIAAPEPAVAGAGLLAIAAGSVASSATRKRARSIEAEDSARRTRPLTSVSVRVPDSEPLFPVGGRDAQLTPSRLRVDAGDEDCGASMQIGGAHEQVPPPPPLGLESADVISPPHWVAAAVQHSLPAWSPLLHVTAASPLAVDFAPAIFGSEPQISSSSASMILCSDGVVAESSGVGGGGGPVGAGGALLTAISCEGDETSASVDLQHLVRVLDFTRAEAR